MDAEQFDAKMLLLKDTLAFHELDSFYPAGLVRSALCWLHDSAGLGWCPSIALAVFVGRALFTVPSAITNAKNQAKMQLVRPQTERLREKMNEARKSGDTVQMHLAQFELSEFDKQNGVGGLKTLRGYVVPGIYFLSFFTAIKRMASAPLESMRSEGVFWFADLTVRDPTSLLPLFCSASMFLTLRSGMDVPTMGSSVGMRRVLLTVLPVGAYFVTSRFESAVGFYWVCTNVFTLLLVVLLKVPAVRQRLALPALTRRSNVAWAVSLSRSAGRARDQVVRTVGLVKQLPSLPRLSYRLVKEKYRLHFKNSLPTAADLLAKDADNFRKAGRGPIIATYKYNPRERFPDQVAPASKKSRWKFFARNR